MKESRLETDVLIIGGAAAGLRSAIEARANGADVLIVSKFPAGGMSCSLVMAGWITGATEENKDQLFKQIVYTGGYLNDQTLVETFVNDAVTAIPGLSEFGVELSWHGESFETPGHYMPAKIERKHKGTGLLQPMMQKALDMGVRVINEVVVTKLMTLNNTVIGAIGYSPKDDQLFIISSKSTVITTGGGAHAFVRNDNPPGSTGDGFVLAYQAGAELINMEFISINMTQNMIPHVFGIGGEPPENILSVGNAHYFLGGIRIDQDCKTSLKGLFAAGEVTGGLLGAARLGGSAIADALVFGMRSGRSSASWAKDTSLSDPNDSQVQEEKDRLAKLLSGNEPAPNILRQLKTILWRYIGPVKSQYTLQKALDLLSEVDVSALKCSSPSETLSAIEAVIVKELGKIIASASLLRNETRGNFWRSDYPEFDNKNWIKNIILSKKGDDIDFRFENVVMTRLHNPPEPPIGAGCFWYFPKLDIS